MKKLLLFLLIVGLAVSGLQAQVTIDQAEPDFENNSLLLLENLSGAFFNSFEFANLQRLAIDANQMAKIDMRGNNNTATLRQSGYNNVGVIKIIGNNNSGINLTQTGSGLFSGIKVNGNANSLDVTQNGTNLQNLLLLEGNNLNFDVIQGEAGITLRQSGSSIPLQIKSSGNSIPIIIRNN